MAYSCIYNNIAVQKAIQLVGRGLNRQGWEGTTGNKGSVKISEGKVKLLIHKINAR